MLPENIPPVDGAEYEPQEAQQDVQPAHEPVEGEQRPVREGEVAGGRRQKGNLYENAC